MTVNNERIWVVENVHRGHWQDSKGKYWLNRVNGGTEFVHIDQYNKVVEVLNSVIELATIIAKENAYHDLVSVSDQINGSNLLEKKAAAEKAVEAFLECVLNVKGLSK